MENNITIALLGTVTSVYIYLLLSPSQPHLPSRPRSFVIQRDTKQAYLTFYENFKKAQYPNYEQFDSKDSNYTSYNDYGSSFSKKAHNDDFFLDVYKDDDTSNKDKSEEVYVPNMPSENFTCFDGWLSVRSEVNFKYLWMHSGENGWMGASATLDTPLHRRSYQVQPVSNNCEGGWVKLRESSETGFLMMVPPTPQFEVDEWVVKAGSNVQIDTDTDYNYHFLLELDGYILNRGSMAILNVMPEAEYSIRGHSTGWDRTKAGTRQYGSNMHFNFLNTSHVEKSIEQERIEILGAYEEDKTQIELIKNFPKSSEKRVISYGLYGTKNKYLNGAIHNAEKVNIYFPGWICRFYVTSDVPEHVVLTLKELGAEIEYVPKGMGYSSGMFWRFMVASDSTVDRFIVRDVDSRLNSRDR